MSSPTNQDVTPVKRRVPFFGIGFLLLVLTGIAIVGTSRGRNFLREFKPEPRIVEKEVIVKEVVEKTIEEVSAPPEITLSSQGTIKDLSNGILFKSKINFTDGEHATAIRDKRDSYHAVYELNVTVPQPSRTLAELEKSNPQLGSLVPGLETLLETAKVSPFYQTLYDNKVKRLERNVESLKKILSRHNFYDCDTILHMQHPETQRRVLLLQGDMDVVSDGSDGDRLATMPDEIVNSTHYQPFTSYGWRKQTDRPNPMVAGWKKRIGNADSELAAAGTSADRKKWLRERKKYLQRGIEDMEARSFLIADYDPFIVLPVNVLLARNTKFAGRVGDYAVVVYKDRVLPAIVGDGGPTFKIGEGSLRLAKELDSRSSSYRRPVSDLGVTYIVFPGSAGPKAPPNYVLWRTRCEELLAEIGGLGEGVELFEWENTLPPIEKSENTPN